MLRQRHHLADRTQIDLSQTLKQLMKRLLAAKDAREQSALTGKRVDQQTLIMRRGKRLDARKNQLVGLLCINAGCSRRLVKQFHLI
ncbi:hypothetical protein LCH33_003856 [Pseudomonas amygdali]|uniref:hypothetical protein n=1 Tax=Pseudomonas amygdali TaxID=47877 RepID=UPI001CD86824|nr:hypothetical protein [Pseudomonas amygdali]UBT80433.1 hypothetical protein LCH33_003856 [Pseudomonas amygdali]